MIHEGAYFLAMLLIALALLKLTSAYLLHRNPDSGLGKGLDWFLTPV